MYNDDIGNNPAAATVIVQSRLISAAEWSLVESTGEALDFGDGCTVIILPRQIEDECGPLRQLRQIVKQEATSLDRSESQRVWRVDVDTVSVLSRLTQLTFEPVSSCVHTGNNVHTWTLTAGRHHNVPRDDSYRGVSVPSQQNRVASSSKFRRPEERNGYSAPPSKANLLLKRNLVAARPVITPKRPQMNAVEAAKRARTDPGGGMKMMRSAMNISQPSRVAVRPTPVAPKDTKRPVSASTAPEALWHHRPKANILSQSQVLSGANGILRKFVNIARGSEKLVVYDFVHTLHRNNSIDNVSTWRCRMQKCRGRVRLLGNQRDFVLVTAHEHPNDFECLNMLTDKNEWREVDMGGPSGTDLMTGGSGASAAAANTKRRQPTDSDDTEWSRNEDDDDVGEGNDEVNAYFSGREDSGHNSGKEAVDFDDEKGISNNKHGVDSSEISSSAEI